ncbi:MAG: FG-GAP-like repeat-containing protein [Gemmataceae bacterium]|nr:FG-GAP-like repeat-containing protein [Gemmataceae bacterium]
MEAVKATDGIRESSNGGKDWEQIGVGTIGNQVVVTDLEYTRDTDGDVTWFAGVRSMTDDADGGVWRSKDDGDTWVRLPNFTKEVPTDKVSRISLAANHDKGEQELYVAVADFNDTVLGVFATADNGDTWRNTNAPNFAARQAHYDMTIGLSPTGRVYVGGLTNTDKNEYGVWESNDEVTAWRNITVDANGKVPHTDNHSWAFSPQGEAFAGTDGGVYRYDPLPFDMFTTGAIQGVGPAAAVVAYDFDGKNGADFAIANGNGVNVYLNKGDGTFNALPRLPMGVDSAPSGLVLGHFDADAVKDIVVLNRGTSELVFLAGANDGSFTEKAVSVAARPFAAASADFDGKNKDDLIIVDNFNRNVMLYLNDGTGKFSDLGAGFDVFDAGSDATAVAVADFDKDGKTDFVVSDRGLSKLFVYKNQGAGKFASMAEVASPGGPGALATGDFNKDGSPDIAVVRKAGKKLGIHLGDGKGGFGTASIDLPEEPTALVAADFDKDGKLDLAIAFHGKDMMATLRGKGDGTFDAPLKYAAGKGPVALAVADFDADKGGTPDLLSVNDGEATYNLSLYNEGVKADSRGTWTSLNSPSLQTLLANAVVLNPSDQTKAMIGAHDNGLSFLADNKWSRVTSGDGGLVRYDPTRADYAYGTLQHKWQWRLDASGGNNTYISVTNTKTYETEPFPFYPEFAIDAKNPSWIAVGGVGPVYMAAER